MDEHGQDAPEQFDLGGLRPQLRREQRRYLPTCAELIDRLTIVILKQVFIPENAAAYRQEREDIEHDIGVVSGHKLHGPTVSAIAILMLSNRVIWENESLARQGGDGQDKLLKFTHSINGVRTRARNEIAQLYGERVDLKVDCFAAELVKEFGNWNLFDAR